MSSDDNRATPWTLGPDSPQAQVLDASNVAETALYVHSALSELRKLTRLSDKKDLKFLDYLLAVAQDESQKLASHVYH